VGKAMSDMVFRKEVIIGHVLPPRKRKFLPKEAFMKITTKMMKGILGFIGVLFLFAPLTVFAQDDLTLMMVPALSGNRPLKNVITVAKANGKFTDPVAAVNSITDASVTNPYLVVIGPGVYTVTSMLVMKQYVDIVGSGENVTKIKGALGTEANPTVTGGLISGANNAALSSLTVENTGGASRSIALSNYSTSPTVTNVTAMASGGSEAFAVYNYYSSPTMKGVTAKASGWHRTVAVQNDASSSIMIDVIAMASGGTNENTGVYNKLPSFPTMTNVTATASGGTDNYGVMNAESSPTMTNVTAMASGGAGNTGVYNTVSSPIMTDVTATAFGGATKNHGINNLNSSSPTMTSVTAKGSGARLTSSYGIYNAYSSNPEIRRTTMSGSTDGLYADTGCTATVSQSTIIGGVGGTGNKTCVACDNGSGTALNASCQ
jgi:hypothetical protein